MGSDRGRRHQRDAVEATAIRQRPVHAGQAAGGADAAAGGDLRRPHHRQVEHLRHRQHASFAHQVSLPGPGVRIERPQIRHQRRMGRRLSIDEVGHPAVLGGGEADPEVQPERCGDLLPPHLSQRPPGHGFDHLAEDPAEGESVVAVDLPRSPHGRGGGNASTDGVHCTPRRRVVQ